LNPEVFDLIDFLDFISSSAFFYPLEKNLVSSLLVKDFLLPLEALDIRSPSAKPLGPNFFSVSLLSYCFCLYSAITLSVSSLNLSLFGKVIVFLPAIFNMFLGSLMSAVIELLLPFILLYLREPSLSERMLITSSRLLIDLFFVIPRVLL
jgi:hypothetical protein